MPGDSSESPRSTSSEHAIVEHATPVEEESSSDDRKEEQRSDAVCEHETSPALDTEDLSVSPADDTKAGETRVAPDSDIEADEIAPAKVQLLDGDRGESEFGCAYPAATPAESQDDLQTQPVQEHKHSSSEAQEEIEVGDEESGRKENELVNEVRGIDGEEAVEHKAAAEGGIEVGDKGDRLEEKEEIEAEGRETEVDGHENTTANGEDMEAGRNADVDQDVEQPAQCDAAAAFQLKPLEFETDFSYHTANWEHFSDSDSDDYFHNGADMEKRRSADKAAHKDGGVQFSRRCSRPESVQDELDAIQCPICLGCLCEPLRLGCAHAFCRLCVISWTETTREDGRSCPLCRAPIEMEDPFSAEVDPELDAEVQRLLSKEEYHESLEASIKQTAQLKQAKASACVPMMVSPPHRRRHAPRVQGEMAELPLFLRQPPVAVGERVEVELRSLGQRVMAQRLHSSPQLLVAAHPLPYPPLRGVLVLVERCRPLSRGVGVKMTIRGLEEGTIQMVRRETAGTVEVPYARLLVRNEEARAVISSFRSYLWAHDTPPGIVDMLDAERGWLSCLNPQRCSIS
mmetsp:Transcript_45266/g.106212  ORF Transcript_45266/g.106212 Transcript_45266/m.106212 type:complete len:572 (-) Transcript_45266:88-1803(-)